MAVYIVGLLLITAAIELTLALVLASQGKVPSPSSDFWLLYLTVDIAFVAVGGFLVPRGLSALRSTAPGSPTDPTSGGPPTG
jgi:hypothetical protein